MGDGPMVSVVVLNYRTPEQTARAIDFLPDAAGATALEVIVVDNASGDGSVDLIRDRCPSATVIEMPSNLGFAAGMNAGIRRCTGDYVLLLNSDVETCPDSINILVRHMQGRPDVGLAAPVLLDEHGEVSRTLLVQPTLCRVFVPGLAKLRYKQWQRRIGGDILDVEATEGSAVIVSRDVLDKAGALDERFFFYHEIVELCMRIRDAGLRVVVVPEARMTHLCGKSTRKLWLPARIELKRSEYQILDKRLGPCVRGFAVLRDALSEVVKSAFYALATGVSLGMSDDLRRKLAVHYAVLRWIATRLPSRTDPRYVKMFGAWD